MSCEGCANKENKPPISIAGPDQLITLPTDSILLDGRTSSDPDGSISSYLWTKISGPVSFNIIKKTDSITKVRSLVAGIYLFELKVTDNLGAVGRDTVDVLVTDQLVSKAKVYPNPATDQITIQIKSLTKVDNTTIRIYDSKGIIVHQENFARQSQIATQQIDVSKLMNGVYYVELNIDPNKITTLMFVKQ